MGKSISFEEIGAVTATFLAAADVAAGIAVTLAGENKVGKPAAGGRICGVAVSAENGYAAVQVRGFASAPCADAAVLPGWVRLAGDGAGGVKKAGASEGAEYLVVSADGAKAVILL